MSSILTAVFKATIGLLVNKGRDKAAEKLKDGDPTDQRFRGLIVREIDDIKSKLDGLAKKDLLASISFFKEGIELLYKVFEKVKMARRECSDVTAGTVSSEAVALTQGIRKLELTGLDESTSRALVNAKKRFERSREKATEAFANEALELSDRVLAMHYRVMATILETVDNPEDALPACRVCIEELHSLSAVKEYFFIELKKGFRSRISKAERRALIATVCHVNRVVYDVTLMVARRGEGCLLPCIEYGEQSVDPIRDSRVSEVLHKAGMEHCCITPWSFGREGEEEHKLKIPWGVATNADGQFIIADDGDKTVKVFDSSGHFILKFRPHTDDDEKKLRGIWNVATDEDSNTYVLVELFELFGTGDGRSGEVLVFNSTADQLCKFPVKWSYSLMVSKNKVLVTSNRGIHVYETDGGYVRSFGDEILKSARDITAGPDGRILVLDRNGQCIHVFTEDGQQLRKFSVRTKEAEYYRVACHPGGENVLVAACDRETFRLHVGIYTNDGECQRTVTLDQTVSSLLPIERLTIIRISVSMAGRIVVIVLDEDINAKLIVL